MDCRMQYNNIDGFNTDGGLLLILPNYLLERQIIWLE